MLNKTRIVFFVIVMLVAIFLVWPGYALFAEATPFILGFPLSFAWVILMTIVGFLAMLGLYISDHRSNRK